MPEHDAIHSESELGDSLRRVLQAESVSVRSCRSLAGGAIQHTLALDIDVNDGPFKGSHAWVLRCDSPSTIAESRSRLYEYAWNELAWKAGVRVARPIAAGRFSDGREFSLVERLTGEALGPRVVRDNSYGGDRTALVAELGRQLSMIHRMKPSVAACRNLGLDLEPVDLAVLMNRALDRLCTALDALGAQRPVLERCLQLARRRAAHWSGQIIRPVALHRDFRTGNLLLDDTGLQAILDWEFAGVGDPYEDIGWFCARCWRFSKPELEAGGLGTRCDFNSGYGEPDLDTARVHFWEIYAHLRWACIALQQGARHGRGDEASLALALTGRIADTLERDALELLLDNPAPLETPVPRSEHEPETALSAGGTVSLAALADILSESLGELTDQVSSEVRLPLRMSRNAAAILGREMRAREQRRARLEELLHAAQAESVAELCQKFRRGATMNTGVEPALRHLAYLDAWIHTGMPNRA